MAAISWETGISGTWTAAADWSTGAVPNASSDVTIAVAPAAGSTAYTVTLGSAASVDSVTLDQAAATLDVDNGTLAVAKTFALAAGNLALIGGTLSGGTYSSTTGKVLLDTGPTGNSSAISGLTWDGALNLASTSDNFANVGLGQSSFAGTAGTGSGTLSIGAEVQVKYAGTTLANVGIVLADGAEITSTSAALTLGSTSTLTAAAGDSDLQVYGPAGSTTGSLTNNGSISVSGSASLTLAGDSIVNAGMINIASGSAFEIEAAVSGSNSGTITVDGIFEASRSFDNTGLVSVSGAASGFGTNVLGAFANAGTFSVSDGAKITLNGAGDFFSNSGTVLISDATLSLGGTLTPANLGTVKIASGGTLGVDGTLTNTGTLSLGSDGTIATLAVNYEGEIRGGTIKDSGGGLVGQGGTLAGVTYEGTLEVGNSESLVVTSGITLEGAGGTGTGTMAITGAGSGVVFAGSQTLNNASITMGSLAASPENTYDDYITVGTYNETAATTLTLGPKLAITQVGADVDVVPAASQEKLINEVINQGTITAGYADGQFQVGNLTNNGTILISNDDNFFGLSNNSGNVSDNGGSISLFGSMSNAGLISIAGTSSTLIDAGPYVLENSGTISVGSGADVTLGSVGGTFSNTGTLLISDATANIGGTFTAASLGTVKISTGGTLGIAGTLTNTGTLVVGTGTSLPALLLEPTGTILGGTISDAGGGIVDDRGTLSGVTYRGELALTAPLSLLTVTGGITVLPTSGTGPGTIAVTGVGSSVTGEASSIDFLGSQSLTDTVIDLGNITGGYGTADGIYLSDSGTLASTLTLAASTTLDQTGLAFLQGAYAFDTATQIEEPTGDTIVNDGTLSLAEKGGIFDTAYVDLDNAGLMTIAKGDQVSVTAGTLTNSGTLAISDGKLVFSTTAGVNSGFTNSGLVTIGAASSLTVVNDVTFSNAGKIDLNGGTLANSDTSPETALLNAKAGSIIGFGTIAAPIINDGRITASGGTLTLSKAVSGDGTLVVDAGDRLNLASVGKNEIALFATGPASVLGLSPATFLGKIGGFAAGDTIDLAKTVAKAASFSGDSLVITLSTGSTIALATTSALTGSLTVVAGTSGDTLIEFGGDGGSGQAHLVPTALQNPQVLAVPDQIGGHLMEIRPEGLAEHAWFAVGH
jgi:hypothetical protein